MLIQERNYIYYVMGVPLLKKGQGLLVHIALSQQRSNSYYREKEGLWVGVVNFTCHKLNMLFLTWYLAPEEDDDVWGKWCCSVDLHRTYLFDLHLRVYWGESSSCVTTDVYWTGSSSLVCFVVSSSKRGDNLEQTLEMIIVIADKDRVYLIHEDSSMFQAQYHRRQEAAAEGLKRTAFTLITTSTLITDSISSWMVISLLWFFFRSPAIPKPFITISFTELFLRSKEQIKGITSSFQHVPVQIKRCIKELQLWWNRKTNWP